LPTRITIYSPCHIDYGFAFKKLLDQGNLNLRIVQKKSLTLAWPVDLFFFLLLPADNPHFHTIRLDFDGFSEFEVRKPHTSF
jgi:hypothetical protein